MAVLDIGIGSLPWLLRRPGRRRFVLVDWRRKIPDFIHYVGIDVDTGVFSKLKKKLARNKHVIKGRVELVVGNAICLPFSDNSFSMVILSDVFSIPEVDECDCDPGCDCNCPQCYCDPWYCDDCNRSDCTDCEYASKEQLCCGVLHRGVSQEEKLKIAQEAIRVLKPTGKLIIANYSTPANAFKIFREFLNPLISEGRLEIKEFLDRTFRSEMSMYGDIRGYYGGSVN